MHQIVEQIIASVSSPEARIFNKNDEIRDTALQSTLKHLALLQNRHWDNNIKCVNVEKMNCYIRVKKTLKEAK